MTTSNAAHVRTLFPASSLGQCWSLLEPCAGLLGCRLKVEKRLATSVCPHAHTLLPTWIAYSVKIYIQPYKPQTLETEDSKSMSTAGRHTRRQASRRGPTRCQSHRLRLISKISMRFAKTSNVPRSLEHCSCWVWSGGQLHLHAFRPGSREGGPFSR